MRPMPSINIEWRRGIGPSVGVGVAMLMHGIVAFAAEDEWRWRLTGSGEQMTLAVTDTDATDALGTLYFTCTRGSGFVDVVSILDDKQRRAIADVVREGKYPTVELSADGEASAISQVRHTDMDGWQLIFQIGPTSKAFNRLRDSGVLEFRVGKTTFRGSFNVGLDQVAEFQNACKTSR
jgi:hypothetical protein